MKNSAIKWSVLIILLNVSFQLSAEVDVSFITNDGMAGQGSVLISQAPDPDPDPPTPAPDPDPDPDPDKKDHGSDCG